MTIQWCGRGALLAAALLAVPIAPRGVAAQAPSACAGQPACAEVSTFVATVTDFRTSTAGSNRLVTLTLRFRNGSPRPLRLGYVAGSGVVTDDQGNRYVTYGADAVRGLGEITSARFDPKFVLQPGEHGDARVEFTWRPSGGEIFGTRYTVELAVREIDPVSATQFRLGREHALQFRGFGDPVVADASAAEPVPASPAAPAGPVAPLEDACAGRTRCQSSGPFVAEVAQVTGSRLPNNTQDHMLRINLRVRNVSSEPVVLAYKSGTSLATDEHGNRYYWGSANTYDRSARGIGVSSSRSVDAQFALRPGESRTATFEVRRFRTGRGVVGSAWTWDVALDQVEPLAGGQVRVVREHSLSFQGLTEAGAVPVDVEKAGRALIDRLRGAAKKPPR